MKLSHYSVKHPVVIAMLLIALIAFGIYCVTGLGLEFVSDMSLPEVEIITIYPGASAEVVEKEITDVLEAEFVNLPGYKNMTSNSCDSYSWITVSFQNDINATDQLVEIRATIDDLVDKLPAGADKPFALVGGESMLPVLEFVILGGEDITRITEYVNDTLKPNLTKINGVTGVDLSGGVYDDINVKLRMDDVVSKGVSILQIYQVLGYSNYSVPLGEVTYQEHQISANYNGNIEDIEQLKNLPVGSNSAGVVIKLSDVADVSYSPSKTDNYVIMNGKDQVAVSVTKRSNANAIKIINQIKSALKDMEKDTNGALSYKITYDNSTAVKESLNDSLKSDISGIIVAVIVVFLFLNNPRTTLIIGSSIPLSFLFTLIGMKITGQSLNLVTMSAFIVSLGMVVDASTVMIEEISKHLGKKEFKTDDAILLGSDEVGPSIVASVLTTIVVFVPLYFLKGLVGMMINSFALVMILSLSASLLVSVAFVPYITKVVMSKHRLEPRKTVFMRFVEWLEKRYRMGLSWSLKHSVYTLILPVLLLGLSFILIFALGFSFLPAVDEGDFYVDLQYTNGCSLEENREKTLQAAEIIERLVPEYDAIAVTVGQSDSIATALTSSPDQSNILITLKDIKRRDVLDIIKEVQYELSSSITDCTVTVTNGGFDRLIGFVAGGGGYKLVLVGNDRNQLLEEAQKLKEVLDKDPDVMSTDINVDYSKLMFSLDMNQGNLSSLGITSYEAGMISAILFNGVDIGNITLSDEKRSTLHLSSDIKDSSVDIQTLEKLPITTLMGSVVTFSEMGEINIKNTVSSISHSNRAISVTVSGTLVSEDTSGVNSRMNDYLKNNPLPEGIDIEYSGIIGLITESLKSVVVAVLIAVFLVYMVMVIQFERFRQPFIVMVSEPFCFIGVIVSMLIFNSSVTLMSVVGFIALSGTVVNNAIILIDWINQNRNRKRAAIITKTEESMVDIPGSVVKGKDYSSETLDYETEKTILFESIVQGGSSRLRPILITTLTTIVGVIPMALSIGKGSEIYAPVGQVMAGGLLTSTLITLFVVPVIYYLTELKALRRRSN